MPIRRIPGTDVEYYLIAFDAEGNERREDGSLLSERVRARVADVATPVTDIFFSSHGWKGDVPAAVSQYDAWVGAMAALDVDRKAAMDRRPGFTPLIVGLHWPSLPWGDEVIPADNEIDAFASRIADTPTARSALRTILGANGGSVAKTVASPDVRAAYGTLFVESGLGHGSASGRPGADQDGFDVDAILSDATQRGVLSTPAEPGVLGVDDLARDVRDALRAPLLQLSFWKMKDRARIFGESGAHDFLLELQRIAPTGARFHLMGHSFGCIVVSATVMGSAGGHPVTRPIDSVFLVQGALSLWAYASDVPYAPGTVGYFSAMVTAGRVRGPIVTTRSTHDKAVGTFYPLGAELRRQLLLRPSPYPKYGGVGAFGVQGLDARVLVDGVMESRTYRYEFLPGHVYNLDASAVIKNGAGLSGAHSDIAHPEVAHVFWQAAVS